ncbi:MAG: hypothetical protein V1875_01560 [Candidatus Altiarchaeota archaeon]
MGRTVKTASMLIADEAGRWSQFRSALRRRDREAFDNLEAVARRHFSAIGNSDIIDPFEAVMLSILLEYEKRLEALEGEGRIPGLSACGPADQALDKG